MCVIFYPSMNKYTFRKIPAYLYIMATDWEQYFLSKFNHINNKASIVTQTINDNINNTNIDNIAGHLKDVIEILQLLETKIDDIQYQLDTNQLQPSEKQITRIKNYQIEHKVIEELFPYMYLFHQYYANNSDI